MLANPSSPHSQYPLEGHLAIGLAKGNELVADDLEASLRTSRVLVSGEKLEKNVGAPSQFPVQPSVSLVPSAVIRRPDGTSQRRIAVSVGASSSRGT